MTFDFLIQSIISIDKKIEIVKDNLSLDLKSYDYTQEERLNLIKKYQERIHKLEDKKKCISELLENDVGDKIK